MSDEVPVEGKGNGLPSGRTRWVGKRAATIATVVVVLMIAATVIGMSQSQTPGQVRAGPTAQVTPTFPSQPLPPYKATIAARVDATYAATWTAQAAEPTPTLTTGIIGTLQDKYPTFYGSNGYVGKINGTWEIIHAGTEWPAPVADYSAPGGYGAIEIYNADNITHEYLIGNYPAPDHSTWLVITAVQGNVLRLKSDKTASLGFDMVTDTFTS